MELEGKRAVVIGLAGSGEAAIKLLHKKGALISATDIKKEEEIDRAVLETAKNYGAELFLGGHPGEIFERADFVVVSPGVPKDLPQLAAARAAGARVISELEFAYSESDVPAIAVTGTNGKTTVVTLIGEILKEAYGEGRVFVGGNIGTPYAELALDDEVREAAAVEVSSFQLEFVDEFRPPVAVLLNITADHLDRYSGFEEYADVKMRIFANQGGSDFAVVNIDDPEVAKRAPSIKSKVLEVSLEKRPETGMWLNGDVMEFMEDGEVRTKLEVADVKLHGSHNLMNVMVSVCAAKAFGVDFDKIKKAVLSFNGLPHRLELVRELDGVRYYNDSKATNAGAVAAAVTGLSGGLILLMGGQAKGCSFAELQELFREKVRLVVAFGECREQLSDELGMSTRVEIVDNIEEAVKTAAGEAESGESVLLSPGCASFDQFTSYKHRGETFRRLVMGL